MAKRHKVSIEVIVPIRAVDEDAAIEAALAYLANNLASGVEVIESSAAIVEEDDEED